MIDVSSVSGVSGVNVFDLAQNLPVFYSEAILKITKRSNNSEVVFSNAKKVNLKATTCYKFQNIQQGELLK